MKPFLLSTMMYMAHSSSSSSFVFDFAFCFAFALNLGPGLRVSRGEQIRDSPVLDRYLVCTGTIEEIPYKYIVPKYPHHRKSKKAKQARTITYLGHGGPACNDLTFHAA